MTIADYLMTFQLKEEILADALSYSSIDRISLNITFLQISSADTTPLETRYLSEIRW